MLTHPPLAVITGASRGIGASYAHALAKQGVDLLLVGRDHSRLEQIAETLMAQYDTKVVGAFLDLTATDAAYLLYDRAQSFGRPISMVIQNAGFGLYGPFSSAPHSKILDMLSLHVRHITESTRLFLPNMIAQGTGNIIIVSSVAGFFPIPYMAEYAATKAYLIAFGRAVAHEVKKTGVTIQVCCPGFTNTDFHRTAGFQPRHALLAQSPDQVAEVSLQALASKRTVVTIGWQGRLTSLITSILPDRMLMALAEPFVKPPIACPPPSTKF